MDSELKKEEKIQQDLVSFGFVYFNLYLCFIDWATVWLLRKLKKIVKRKKKKNKKRNIRNMGIFLICWLLVVNVCVKKGDE